MRIQSFLRWGRPAALLLLILSVGVAKSLATAPINDDVAQAILLSGLSVSATGSNIGATQEMDDPIVAVTGAGGKSVWWKWVAPESRDYTVTTADSDFDSVLAIFEDVSGSLEFRLPQAGPTATIKHFVASAGSTYYFAVDGTVDIDEIVAEGMIKLVIAAENDSFDQALILSGSNLLTTGSNVDASVEPQEDDPSVADGGGGHSIWWKWTAPANGSVTITTLGSSFDTSLAVYTGTDIANLQLIDYNDDNPFGNTTSSRIDFTAQVTTNYFIRVDGIVASTGNVSLTVGMNNVAAQLTVAAAANNQVQVGISGGIGTSYRLETAPTINTPTQSWTTLKHFVTTNGVNSVLDTRTLTKGFYRVVTPDLPIGK